MTELDAIRERHSVRQYMEQPLRAEELGIVKYHFEIGAGKEHFQWR